MALSAAATKFRALNITQRRLAQLFAVKERTVRHWRYGDRHLPRGVAILVHLLAAGAITVAQIEQAAAAAVPSPAHTRTDGKAEPEPPAPYPVEPAPAQTQTALAPTLAQKVVALAPNTCHWPTGDPRHPDFHFCGRPTTAPPYCNEHRIAAHMTPPVGGQKPSNLAAGPPRTGFGRPSHDVGGTVALSV